MVKKPVSLSVVWSIQDLKFLKGNQELACITSVLI